MHYPESPKVILHCNEHTVKIKKCHTHRKTTRPIQKKPLKNELA